MRLAATMTPMRDAARQAVALRGTLRDQTLLPHEVTILDLSTSGFLAELPRGMELDPGTRVRVAATPLGAHEAIAVRRDSGYYGFAFIRPIAGDAVVAADGDQGTTVTAFPGDAPGLPIPAAAPIGEERPVISARASLLLVGGLSVGLWSVLAVALWVSSPFG